MDLATSFGAMRNGAIEVTILDALQVDAADDRVNRSCGRTGVVARQISKPLIR